MKIIKNNQAFILETVNTHYALCVDSDGMLGHLHWGKKCEIRDYAPIYCDYERNSNSSAREISKTEYITYGGPVYRPHALIASHSDGCRETVLTYDDYRITTEKDSALLEIFLSDKAYKLNAVLCYKIRENTDIIERWAVIENQNDTAVTLNKVLSAEFNMPSKRPYKSINYNGSWGAEFRMESSEIKNGRTVYEGRKGGSDHTNSPMFILHQNADEDRGEVYFGALAWSGNFKSEISRDYAGFTRVAIGINDFDFSYRLSKGESFKTPCVYCGYSFEGFSGMSNSMNRFAVEHILPRGFAKKALPVLYNSWEATWFDVSCEGQQKLAELAADIGCELFVMDDGWFGQRKDDRAGLGDWYVNKEKFPEGLKPLIDRVNDLGMDFGLWFEPEMVNPDSDLYRAHPEWIYNYKTRKPTLLRSQLVLNLTRDDVKEFVFDCMDRLLEEYNIRYIKWDMNRAYSETGADNLSNPQELWYRHTAAVYDIADRLKAKHKELQIECCASGGGRADLGALSHFDMIWTSDNTDPVDRLEIQHGYSLLYPIKCMRAWVTDTNRGSRPRDWDFRFNVAMQGSLSIGGNLLRYDEKELELHKRYITLYKSIRDTVQFGAFYRLADFEKDGFYATEYTDDDKCVLFICTSPNCFFNDKFRHLSLRGLDEKADYCLSYKDKDYIVSGSTLVNRGFEFELGGTLNSRIFVFNKQ